jgi:preprotein translocase subunit YajC
VEELGGLLLPVAFLALLWFLLIRPQQKRRKEQQQMVRSLNVGDDIVTIGGLHGRVIALTDSTMDVTVDADEDVVMRFERASLGRVVADDAPAADEADLVDDPAEDAEDERGS